MPDSICRPAILLVLLVIAACGFTSQEAEQLPVLGEIRGFTLTASDGREQTAEELKGNAWVANFFFTSCLGPCPILNGYMVEMSRSRSADERVRFVSITVDPLRDTPAALAAYAERMGAPEGKWLFLTGSETEIARTSRNEFRLATGDAAALHSTRFVLVDRALRIRGYYDGLDDEARRRLDRDLDRVLAEK